VSGFGWFSARKGDMFQFAAKGRKVMAAAKTKVRELFSEFLEDERSGNELPRFRRRPGI
jgi:hypothetical protein